MLFTTKLFRKQYIYTIAKDKYVCKRNVQDALHLFENTHYTSYEILYSNKY